MEMEDRRQFHIVNLKAFLLGITVFLAIAVIGRIASSITPHLDVLIDWLTWSIAWLSFGFVYQRQGGHQLGVFVISVVLAARTYCPNQNLLWNIIVITLRMPWPYIGFALGTAINRWLTLRSTE